MMNEWSTSLSRKVNCFGWLIPNLEQWNWAALSSPASAVIPNIRKQQNWMLDRVGIVGPAPLFKITRWFSVKHQLQDWMDGPGRLGVSQSTPFVHMLPVKIQLLLTSWERWIFNNCEEILTLITHCLVPPLFLMWWSHAGNLEWEACWLAEGPYQKNTTPAVRLEPALLRMQMQAFYQKSYPGPSTCTYSCSWKKYSNWYRVINSHTFHSHRC